MNKSVVVETKRLKLRTLRVKDISDKYVKGLNDPEVNRYLVNARLKKQTHGTIRNFITANLKSKTDLLLGLFTKEKNELIGTIRISRISYFHHSCSLGICLFNKVLWGEGYSLEGLSGVVKFIFDGLKLHYIEAGVYRRNVPAARLFKGTGFLIKTIFSNKYRYKDGFEDVIVFGKENPSFDFSLLKK
jgi:RimJ/RimL family protein N-acetyltransferase